MKFGKTFGEELAAAGLRDAPISWTKDEVFGAEDLAPDKKAALDAVVAAHDPNAAPPNAVTRTADIFRRMTDQEYNTYTTVRGQQNKRKAAIFDTAVTLRHNAPDFAELKTAMTQAFGAERAGVLLAPSED